MAKIVINEISQNYTYNIGNNEYAGVAFPITACWGPGFMDPNTMISDEELEYEDPTGTLTKLELMLERTAWQRFPATQAGLESFVATYRGPSANYRLMEDNSYQIAMTLLTAGYDVWACRVSPGSKAQNAFVSGTWSDTSPRVFTPDPGGPKFYIKAKYPGSFGNSLRVQLTKFANKAYPLDATKGYWSMVVYIVDASGVQTAAENLIFSFDIENSTDSILHIDEQESNFVTWEIEGNIHEDTQLAGYYPATQFLPALYQGDIRLGIMGDEPENQYSIAGTDLYADNMDGATNTLLQQAWDLAYSRYTAAWVGKTDAEVRAGDYLVALSALNNGNTDRNTAVKYRYQEWLYNSACYVYDLLRDRLAYNPQRIISPGWDDQDINKLNDMGLLRIADISPMHIKLMDTGYYSRCGCAYLDIPKSASRRTIYTDDPATPPQALGYAQLLARYVPPNAALDVNGSLYHTNSALFCPWGQYTYVGTSKMSKASPSFLALMIQRAMILNQAIQYEWALPNNRKHSLRLGKLDYKTPKKLLDIWQKLEGVGVNVITEIPDLGVNVWGNSTLFEVPPATYQALANLSTRWLVNAIENVAYKCGISITFQYNNNQAYSKFYAGVTPILDTMRNVGAIEDWHVSMRADINGLDRVNANTVIGTIVIVPYGVINDIEIDLVALPPGSDLSVYRTGADQI